MKDFKRATLYDNELGAFKRFVDEILETQTEYSDWGRNRDYRKEEDDGLVSFSDSYSDLLTSDPYSFDQGLGGFGGFSTSEPIMPTDYERQSQAQQVITAPIHGYFSVLNVIWNKEKFGLGKKTDINFLKKWVFIGIGLGLFSLLGITGLFITLIHWHIGVLLILSGVLSDLALHYIYHEKSVFIDMIDGDDEEESGEESGEEEGEVGFDLEDNEDDLFSGIDFDFSGEGGTSQGESIADLFEDEFSGELDELEDEDPEEMSKILEIFPESKIETSSKDGEKFRRTLIKEFNNKQSKGEMLLRREDIFREYATFMPNNDKGFSKWFKPKERAVEYLNVAYTIYKALVEINNAFSLEKVENQKLTIIEMKRTPLLYKVTVKLPSFFKLNQMMGKEKVFVDMAKASDKDTEVGVLLTSFGGNLVVKFLKFDYKGIVSMGDLIRMDDEDPTTDSLAEQIVESRGLPIVAGLRNNEYPYMVDLEGNPAASVVGGTGSGKSWLTFQMVMSMMITTSPEELNIIVMDAKNAAIWKQLALSPHVIGYHSDIWKFSELLDEIDMEHQRRMAFLSENGVESWKDLRKTYKKKGMYDELWKVPMLVVIIDEITYTMNTLSEQDVDVYKKVKSQLSSLSSVIRSSGIRFILIGQRAIDTSIPRTYLANSPLKLGMKMNNISEFEVMFDKMVKNAPRIPSGPGEGLMLSEGQVELSYVKTVIPAGFDDGDVLMHLRTVSLDWVRRTIGGDKDYLRMFNNGMETTIKKGFNRNEFYIEALNALKEGRITDTKLVDKDYAGIDGNMYTPQSKSITNSYKEEISKERPFEEEKVVKQVEEVISEFDIDWTMIDELGESENNQEELYQEEHQEEYQEEYQEELYQEEMYGDDVLYQEEFNGIEEFKDEITSNKNSTEVFESEMSIDFGEIEEDLSKSDLNDSGLTLDDLFSEDFGEEQEEVQEEIQEEVQEEKQEESVQKESQGIKKKILAKHDEDDEIEEVEVDEGEITLPTKVLEEMKKDMEEKIRKSVEQETQQRMKEQVDYIRKSVEDKYKKKLNKEENISTLRVKQTGARQVVHGGNDSKNMGVDQFIYENGEEVEERGVKKHRVKADVIKALYNKRKVEIALVYGAIYLEDGYYYVTL